MASHDNKMGHATQSQWRRRQQVVTSGWGCDCGRQSTMVHFRKQPGKQQARSGRAKKYRNEAVSLPPSKPGPSSYTLHFRRRNAHLL